MRRHKHAALSSVFAYPEELDAWWDSRPPAESATLAPAVNRSLAVLPFENLTRLPADEILSDGLTEEVIATLARIEGLDRARSERSLCVQWVAVDPIWDDIREDPRFSILLQRMNIPATAVVTTVRAGPETGSLPTLS